MILIWSFPEGPATFLHALDVVAWFVWACFAVDYLARILLSVRKLGFIRTHKLDLLMLPADAAAATHLPAAPSHPRSREHGEDRAVDREHGRRGRCGQCLLHVASG